VDKVLNVEYRNVNRPLKQAHSQALSPLPPLVVGRKTLVTAGHVTTQNLGGKKSLLGGRGGRVF